MRTADRPAACSEPAPLCTMPEVEAVEVAGAPDEAIPVEPAVPLPVPLPLTVPLLLPDEVDEPEYVVEGMMVLPLV